MVFNGRDRIDSSRAQTLQRALGLVKSGESIDIFGRRFAGRSHFLDRLREELEDAGWAVVSVSGVSSLQGTPLAALDVAGLVANPRTGSGVRAAVAGLVDLAKTRRTAVLVDDWNALDETTWGVLMAAQEIARIPIARTSLRRRDRRLTPTGREATTSPRMFAIDLVPLRIDELEEVLIEVLGGSVEPSLVSRVFGKSAGIVGLAVSIVVAARSQGALRLVDDVWTVVEGLWVPELARIVESYLSEVSCEELDTLEALALVGALDVETAREALDWDAVESLEDRALVRFYRSGTRTYLNIIPPLVAEYLAHERSTSRRTRMTDQLGKLEQLGHLQPNLDETVSNLREPDAFFVRMLSERSRSDLMIARAQWERSLDCKAAEKYLRLLNEQHANPDEIRDVLTRTDAASGDRASRARFKVFEAWWRAHHGHDLDGALDLLAEDRDSYGPYSGLLDVAHVEILAHLRQVPEDFESILELRADMPPVVFLAVAECRAIQLLTLGRVEEARRILERRSSDLAGQAAYPRGLIEGLLLVFEGDLDGALQLADRAFASARDELDVRALRSHSYLIALSLFLSGRYREVEPLVDMVFALGEPPHFPQRVHAGMLAIGAVVAMRRGKSETAATFITAMKRMPARDTLLPFTRWPEAQELVLADDNAAAAALLWDDADALWSRGGRLSALLSQIAAVGMNPRGDWLEVLRSRVDLIDSPLLQAQADSVEMLQEQDADLAGIHASRLLLIGEDAAGAETHDLFEFRQVRPRLSDREVEVARLIAQGLSNQQIAQRLTLSPRTVENHVHRALRKLGGTRRADLLAVVHEPGVR